MTNSFQVKPGGYIQIVDGYMPTDQDIKEGDKPSMKIFKGMGNFLKGCGLRPDMSPELEKMMREAGGHGVVDIGFKAGTSRLGKGASEDLVETGFVQIRGLSNAMKIALGKMKDVPMSLEDWPKLNEAMLEEAAIEGVDMYSYVAWGRTI